MATSSFWIIRRRTRRSLISPTRLTSRKTSSGCTIRLTRSRAAQRRNPSRPRPSPHRRLRRLRRNPRGRNHLQRSPSSKFSDAVFWESASGKAGGAFLFLIKPFPPGKYLYRLLPAADHPVRFLERTSLYHFFVALLHSSDLLCLRSSLAY